MISHTIDRTTSLTISCTITHTTHVNVIVTVNVNVQLIRAQIVQRANAFNLPSPGRREVCISL